jgi:hypothetical protein
MLLVSTIRANMMRQANTFSSSRNNQFHFSLFSSMNIAVQNSSESITYRGFLTSIPCCDQTSAAITSEHTSMVVKDKLPVKESGKRNKTTKYAEVKLPVTRKLKGKASSTVSPKSREKMKNENWAYNDEETTERLPMSKKNFDKLIPRKPFPIYFGEERVELPEQLQSAMRNDPTYFHGIEGLGTQWSSPSVKPSEHPAVKEVLHQLYIKGGCKA